MSLSFASPPGDAWNALVNGLEMIRQGQRLDPRGGGSLALPPAPVVMRPYPVYFLGLWDMEVGKGLETAKLVAWRYLLVDNNQVRLAAEVSSDGQGGCRFNSLTNGYMAGSEQAFTVAENLPENRTTDYEIRALRAPGLNVEALWLKDLQGEEDRVIVLPPVFPPLRPLAVYSTADLLTILQQKAAIKAPLERQVRLS